MSFSPRQLQAAALLSDTRRTRVLLYGGTRSGKSFAIAHKIRQRAIEFPGCKQVIFRKTLADVTATFWAETLRPVINGDVIRGHATIYKQPLTVEYKNGSVIRFGGLHVSEIDRALGIEYATVFVNEASESAWQSVPVLFTRLNDRAKNAHGVQVVPKFIADCNPPTTRHWLHSAFILKQKPDTGEALPDADAWASLQLNPGDNIANLAPDYLQQLESLSPRDKQRFYFGEFGQLAGLVFDNFDPEQHVIDDCDLRGGRIYRSVDFGFVHPFVCLFFHVASDETVTVFKEIVQSGVTIDRLAERIKKESEGLRIEATCADHDAGERALLANAGVSTVRADKAVLPGINSVYALLSRNKLKVFRSCKKTIDGFYAYRWKENAKRDEIVKEHDDEMDSLRYGVQTFVARGPAVSVGVVPWL
ncbi:MAG: hypothetical protein IPJ01_12085 [Micavibrio sp.]|nr:hypothetical protein [Micavibrio sp.]